jgi:hypothetical protein
VAIIPQSRFNPGSERKQNASRFGLALVAPVGMMPSVKLKRVPQPPVNPAQRDLERHEFWPGFIAALIAAILLFCGARHLTAIDTAEGGTAYETQLVKAFSVGGLQYADRMAPPPPPKLDDPAAAAQALDRWARENANAKAPTWKIRVDTSAVKACPT